MSAPIETSNGARGRRSKFAGEGLVTPIRPMQITCEGVRETIRPARDRFCTTHEAVVKRPELFTPCNRRDSHTATELRSMITRSTRRTGRTAKQSRQTGGAPSWALSRTPDRCPPWQL